MLISANNQIAPVVLAVLQGRYPGAITVRPIRQLRWTDTKTTSKNLIISFWITTRCSKDWPKKLFSSYLQILYRIKDFQSNYINLDIFNKSTFSCTTEKTIKTIHFDNTYDLNLTIGFGNYIYANLTYDFFDFWFWLFV